MFDDARDFIQTPAPFVARPQSVEQGEANGGATETFTRQIKTSQPPPAEISTRRNASRIRQNQRTASALKADNKRAEQAEIVITHAGHDRPRLENNAKRDARGHADEHSRVKRWKLGHRRRRDAEACDPSGGRETVRRYWS